MKKWLSHLAAVGLLALVSVSTYPNLVANVLAADQAPPPEPRLLSIVTANVRNDASRSPLSQRTADATPTPEPTSFPTPVAIDPDATPLAAPTATPPPPPSFVRVWPVAGRITTYYSQVHTAIDIGAPCGTSVAALGSGVITWMGWKNNGGGLVVEQLTDEGLLVSYNHLSTALVNVGAYVSAGVAIAGVGMTGNATGCHLHLALARDGYWQNPLAYLP